MATNIGPKIGIDGEAEYRRQLQNIIQQSKTLDSQMKALTSSFGKNADEQEKTALTAKMLRDQIDSQKDKVTLLTRMLAEAERVYGENATQTLKWKQAVYDATTQLNKMEGKLDDSADAADDYADEIDDASKQTSTFGDVLKANLVSDVLMRGMDMLIDKAKEFASGMITAAADVRAEIAQYTQTFGDFGDEADRVISSIATESGIIDTRLRSAASGVYAFAKASGADSQEAMELMSDALRAAADSSAYYDRSLEDTTDTLMSFLKGNFANDAALGVSATETTRNAKAMELFGEKYADLSEIQKQKTLLRMVTDAQKLSGAMGQAKREADGWENVQGNLNETIRQFQAKAGTAFLDQLTPRIKKVTEQIENLADRIDWEGLADGVEKTFGFFEQHGKDIAINLGAIGTAFLAFESVKAVNQATEALKGFSATAMLLQANPFAVAASGAILFTGAVSSLLVYLNEETAAQKASVEATDKYAESIHSAAKSYQDVVASIDSMAEKSAKEVDRTRALSDELNKLVDANGKVRQGNEERAAFIVGELSAATGVEIELIEGEIKGYTNLKNSIDEVIKQRQFDIELQALESKYTEALNAQEEAVNNLGDAEAAYAAQDAKLKAALIERDSFYTNVRNRTNLKRMAEVENSVKVERDNLLKLDNARTEARDTYSRVMSDIGKYEQIRNLQNRGFTDEALAQMQKWRSGMNSVSDESGKMTDEQIADMKRLETTLKAEIAIYGNNLKNGVAGYTKDGLAALQNQLLALEKKSYSSGGNFVQGFINGINSKKAAMTSAVTGVFKVAASLPSKILREGSPSKITTQNGLYYGEGFEIGAKRSLKAATDSIKEQFRAISQLHPVTQYGTTAASASVGASYQYGGFNINVYGQAGQSAQDIANAVGAEIQRAINNKKAVFA